jgi:hypothetical protein
MVSILNLEFLYMLKNLNVRDRCKEAVCDILCIKCLQSGHCAHDHITKLCISLSY